MNFPFYKILSPALLLLFLVPGLASAADTPPNILILIGDDIDRDCLGPWGGQAITPNLDRLAAEGVRFNRAYCNVAMCAPYRQELYSGRTVWRTRAMPNHSQSLPETESLPHYLRPLGYRVALLGKRHFGPKQSYPFELLGEFPKLEDPNPLALERARKYMKSARDAEEPFCLVVTSNDAHGPYTTGDRSAYDPDQLKLPEDTIDTPEYRQELVKHLAEVTNLDTLLGGLRAILEEEKLSENTLVIYLSEQGNGFPFAKWTCFDDGLATGIVAALPGVIPAGIASDRLFWLADIAPTLIEVAGGRVAPEAFDGKSQWANFKGANEGVHEYAYGAFTNCNIIDNRQRVFPIRSIRDERFTLIWSPRSGREVTSNVTLTQAMQMLRSGQQPSEALNTAGSWVATTWERQNGKHNALVNRFFYRPEWALYDREADPEELVNRFGDPEYKEPAQRLKQELLAWLDRWGDGDPVATETAFVKNPN